KDLLATRGYRTTFGAKPYEDQVIDMDATVVRKLNEAGAILVAKLTLGALAQGDQWFGGMTRNPWKLDQGSSGSSAGPGAATAAGLVGFSIGTETLGSIVSPSTRNGVTGLRPTYGTVSRHGAMALSWSLDKIGPMGRSGAGCGGRNGQASRGRGSLVEQGQDRPDVSQRGGLCARLRGDPRHRRLRSNCARRTLRVGPVTRRAQAPRRLLPLRVRGGP